MSDSSDIYQIVHVYITDNFFISIYVSICGESPCVCVCERERERERERKRNRNRKRERYTLREGERGI